MDNAPRLDRFWAKLVDSVPVALVGVIAAILMPQFKDTAMLPVLVGVLALGMIGYVVYQLWLVATTGQTIGKRYMGIKIVRASDLMNGGFVTNILLRGVACAAITLVPVLGALFALADPFFVFREDNRCLHDHVAGTRVVKA